MQRLARLRGMTPVLAGATAAFGLLFVAGSVGAQQSLEYPATGNGLVILDDLSKSAEKAIGGVTVSAGGVPWRVLSARLEHRATGLKGWSVQSLTGHSERGYVFSSKYKQTPIGIFVYRDSAAVDTLRSGYLNVPSRSPQDPIIWRDDALTLKSSSYNWSVRRVRNDPSMFPYPFWVLCRVDCPDSDVDALIATLRSKSANRPNTMAGVIDQLIKNQPVETKPLEPPKAPEVKLEEHTAPEGARKPDPGELSVVILDNEKEVRASGSQWNVEFYQGSCAKRKPIGKKRVDARGEAKIQLPAVGASDYCIGVSDAGIMKCFAAPRGVPTTITLYEHAIKATRECPQQGEWYNVVLNLYGELTGKPRQVQLADFSPSVDIRIDGKRLEGNRILSNLANDEKVPIKVGPENYYVAPDIINLRIDEAVDRTRRDKTITIGVVQQFVDLKDLRIEPQNSSGGRERDCDLRVVVSADAMKLTPATWEALRKNRKALDARGVIVEFSDGQYTFPDSVRRESQILVRWPINAASPVSVVSVGDPELCNISKDTLVERSAFFGTPFAPTVRVSKPGFALIATRLDRNDMIQQVGVGPPLESTFWNAVFKLANDLEGGPQDRTSFEWARISQFQSGASTDREFLIAQPSASGGRLFGSERERDANINGAVHKLFSVSLPSQERFRPIDVSLNLEAALRKMAGAGEGSNQPVSNVRVLVAGPKLVDQFAQTICHQLKADGSAIVTRFGARANTIRLAFIEIVGSAVLPSDLARPSQTEGLLECRLQGTPLEGLAVAYLLRSTALAGEGTRTLFDAIGPALKIHFKGPGG